VWLVVATRAPSPPSITTVPKLSGKWYDREATGPAP